MPTRRRIVLLAADGSVDRVLARPPALEAIASLRFQARLHPGRRLAAEWLKGAEWIRWITTGVNDG